MSPSLAASIVFLAVSLTRFHTTCSSADDNNTVYDLRYKDCSTTTGGNSSSNSDDLYQMNLRQFLAALPSKAINNSGYFNGTVGSSATAGTGTSTGTVFGMAMCQADVPWPDQCDRCLQAATGEAPKACPSSSNASVAYQGCVLRYSDAPILAVANDNISNGYAFYAQSHAAGVPDTAAFGQTRKDLFAALASAAVVSPLMIATGNRTFNSTHNMYGLAQCNRDLPRELCSYMITTIVENIPYFAAEVQWSEGVSITGFSFYIRYDLKPFAVYVPPTGTAGPSQPETGKGGLVQRVEAIVIPVSILIIFFLVAYIFMKKREIKNIVDVTGLTHFAYGNIKSATKNFGKAELLGEGGFGKVYKGTFNIHRKQRELAVKCVTNPSAAKNLKDELKILAKLEHKNVVQLVGFCNNDGWFRLAGDCTLGQSVIEWPLRYQIIRGICAGLQYLHQDHNRKILHMDLKPSNILLDEEMKPKIADFGLSRAFLNTKTHTYTDIVKGSLGYMAPEFVDNGRARCDIYSLGMLILGIVMRAGPPSTSRDPSGVSFINKVQEKFIFDSEPATTVERCRAKDQEQLKKDASLRDDDCIEDVEKCVGIAFECVNEDPNKRPEATDICTRLINQDNRAHISLQVNQLHK